MNISSKILKKLGMGASLVLALGVSTHAQNGEWLQVRGTPAGEFARFSYVDFSTTTTNGFPHPVKTLGGVPGLKTKFLQLSHNGSSGVPGQCFTVNTALPRNIVNPPTQMDTRLWIASHLGSTTPISLADDNAGNRHFIARVWLKGTNDYVNFYVAAFSTAFNNIHFDLRVNQEPLTEADCTTGQTLPWVKVKSGVMTKSP